MTSSGQSRVNPAIVAALLSRRAAPPPTLAGGIAGGLDPIAKALTIRGLEGRQKRERDEASAARGAAIKQALAAGLGGQVGDLGEAEGITGTTGPTNENAALIGQPTGAIDRSAIARALAGSEFGDLQTAGLNMLLKQPDQAEPFTLSPGQKRFGGGGRELASVAAEAEAETSLIRNLNAANIDPQSDEGQQIIRQSLTRPQSQVNIGRPLTLSPGQIAVDPASGEEIARGQEKKTEDKPFTGEQAKTAGFARRMINAEQRLQSLELSGFDPADTSNAVLQKIPGGNFFLSAEAQNYRQAQEDWVRSVLRKESGAVIGDQEMAKEITAFFPQPGDAPETIKQKAAARQERIEGLIGESQGAFEGLFGAQQTAEPASTKLRFDAQGNQIE